MPGVVMGESAYVYIYDLRRKVNARAEDIRAYDE
jgi:hypothetical protein